MEQEELAVKELRKKVVKSMAAVSRVSPQTIEAKDPKLAIKVLETLSLTGSLRKTEKECGVSRDALKRMCKAHKEVIGDWREYAAGEAFLLKERVQALMHKKMDSMEEDDEQIRKTNLRDFAQAASMLGENYLVAMGEGPKQAVTVNIGPTVEDVAKHLQEIREKIQRQMAEKKAQAINV
jgi:ElaB/YqjD/DUF883 family membrane-anchored ribosome-binding protein